MGCHRPFCFVTLLSWVALAATHGTQVDLDTDEESEAQRGSGTCSLSHSYHAAWLRFKPTPLGSKASAFN